MHTVREDRRARELHRLRTAFATVNALGFGAVAALTALARTLVATPLIGPVNLGMALLLLQCLLLLGTAARFDRGCADLERGHRG